jgi:hypothetical protein
MGPAKLPPEVPLLFRGPQPYRTGDRLPGRQADGDACWLGLEQDRFFILEGESGCGKSSLLNAFLFPRAQKEFQTIRVRVTDDPFQNVLQALRELVGAAAPDWPADSSGLRQAIQAVAPSKGGANGARPVLLCIDQFEEIFGVVNDRVRSSFMEELRNAIHCRLLRLLVVVRIDYSDLLINLCREVDPDGGALDPGNYFVLKPFRKEQGLRVVHEIFSPITAGNQQLERELDMFGEALVEEEA